MVCEDRFSRSGDNSRRWRSWSSNRRLRSVYRGWPAAGPFDAIIATAAYVQLPMMLLEQLAPNGRLITPIGWPEQQTLSLFVRREDGGIERTDLTEVNFSMMPGPGQIR